MSSNEYVSLPLLDADNHPANGAMLECTACGDSHLHHGEISIDEHGDIAIRFWCEGCPESDDPMRDNLKLLIHQHKGKTYLSWQRLVPT